MHLNIYRPEDLERDQAVGLEANPVNNGAGSESTGGVCSGDDDSYSRDAGYIAAVVFCVVGFLFLTFVSVIFGLYVMNE